MERANHEMLGAWHRAINQYHDGKRGDEWKHWLYDAKDIADEVARIQIWFMYERTGQLPKIHRQCSHSQPETIQENHLSCCLGVKCKECPFLLAMEKAEVSPDQLDEIKAWTCASHILHEKVLHHVDTSEGFILHEGDKMYWKNVIDSLSFGMGMMEPPDSDDVEDDDDQEF